LRPSAWQTITFEVALITGLAFLLEKSWRYIWKMLPALNTALFPDLIHAGLLPSQRVESNSSPSRKSPSIPPKNRTRLALKAGGN
jgi:hypothetical protein